jgi:hypothetical protein
MRIWLAAILLILHSGLFMSGFVPADALCLENGECINVSGHDGPLDPSKHLPPYTQKDPRSDSQEIPETGEPEPDYCGRHALVIHTGLYPEVDLIYADEHLVGKPRSVSAEIHKPPPELLVC